MSYNIVLLCGTVMGAVFILAPVKELKSSYFAYGAAAVSVLITVYALRGAVPVMNYFSLFDTGEFSSYFKILIKVLGITVLCNMTSDFVTELGMPTASGKIEFAGKIAIMTVTLPLFDVLLKEVQKLL